MRPDVVGFGESSVDHVCTVGELPHRGTSKVRIESSFRSAGGQVATTMAGCAVLGLASSYLGAIGDDDNGRFVRAELSARGVDTSRLIVRRAATRSAVVLVDGTTGDRTVLWERDERLDVPPEAITREDVQNARVVHVDGVDERASIRIAMLAREAGALVTCDIDSVTPRTGELLSHVTLPVLAAEVPAALTGISDVEQSLRALRLRHAGPLCVTLGARGSAVLDGQTFIHVDAVGLAVVDTTGAGDIFRAGFIYGALQRWPMRRTLAFANAAAALSCSRRGAVASAPPRAEVESLTGR